MPYEGGAGEGWRGSMCGWATEGRLRDEGERGRCLGGNSSYGRPHGQVGATFRHVLYDALIYTNSCFSSIFEFYFLHLIFILILFYVKRKDN